MTRVADAVDAVVGIDTHRDTHEIEIATSTASVISTTRIPNTEQGFTGLLTWISAHAPGPRVLISIEGTRSYGHALTRALQDHGLWVIECEQPSRKQRRGRGKSDPIDAHLAVLSALSKEVKDLPQPRADGDREALRILLVARQDLTTTHTAQTNRLKALLRSGDDTDRRLAARKITQKMLTAVLQRQLPENPTRLKSVSHEEIHRLAHALTQGLHQEKDNEKQITAIVNDLAPGLLDTYGIGPISAAQAIISFSHPGRCRSEAAFAALAGTNPVPASSGRITRHRLNRGGDRALNKALHTIAVTRLRGCPRTREYLDRRTADGRTPQEIRRCLKRYIARELYKTLTTAMTPNKLDNL